MVAPTPDLLTRYHNEPRMRMVTLEPGAYDAYMCWGAVHGRAGTILRSVEAFALSNRFTAYHRIFFSEMAVCEGFEKSTAFVAAASGSSFRVQEWCVTGGVIVFFKVLGNIH